MDLRKELGFPMAIQDVAHEAVLNILVTADLLAKEGERVVAPYGMSIGDDLYGRMLGRRTIGRARLRGLMEFSRSMGAIQKYHPEFRTGAKKE